MTKIRYAIAIDSMMHTMVCIHLDFSHGICVVSRYMANPNISISASCRWSLRYFQCTVDTCLKFGRCN